MGFERNRRDANLVVWELLICVQAVSSQGFQRLEFVQDEHLPCPLDWKIVRGLTASADIAIQPFCSFVILLALSPD